MPTATRQVWGLLGCQKEAAFAAERVIVVVEELVDEAVIRADPNRTIIPGLIVDAVVVEPWGAHPSYVQGTYDRDNRFYLDWDPISRDAAATDAWLGGMGPRRRRPGGLRREARRRAAGRPPPERPGPVRLGRLRRVPMTDRTASPRFTKSEMMIAAAARELAGQRVCFVGVGLPNIAVNLAKRTVAPDLELVYEAGVFGARPARLPLSIGDPTIVSGATAAMSMFELFAFYLQGGLVDVGFLGAAQIDRFGNINTTVIGDYATPTTRLPGSGGACEIAINARQIFVIMRQSRALVRRDGSTSGPRPATSAERPMPSGSGASRAGSAAVHRSSSPTSGSTTSTTTARCASTRSTRAPRSRQVRDTIGWEPRISPDLAVTPAPTGPELELMRVELDPGGTYIR